MKKCYFALLSTGTNIAIIGNRGIGKSSLASQIQAVANGNNDILEKIGMSGESKADFLTIYFACGDNIENYTQLLSKLLTTKDCLGDWIYNIPTAIKEVSKLNGGFNVGVAQLKGDLSTEEVNTAAIKEHDIDVVFANVVNAITEENIAKNGIFLIIDEYDRIKDKAGFAAFLKSAATNLKNVKFCIVGVAQDLQQLLSEHESADRLFAGGIVHLPPMNSDELKKIIETAENAIHQTIVFDEGSRDRIVALAHGHPYIIHLIGKYSMRLAHMEKIKTITISEIERTLKNIAETNADPIMEGRYKKAVIQSKHRENVLRTFSEDVSIHGEILTTPVYKRCMELGVDNPSFYVGQLVQDDFGSELVKVRDSYYRFKDSLFKAYVSARPMLTT